MCKRKNCSIIRHWLDWNTHPPCISSPFALLRTECRMTGCHELATGKTGKSEWWNLIRLIIKSTTIHRQCALSLCSSSCSPNLLLYPRLEIPVLSTRSLTLTLISLNYLTQTVGSWGRGKREPAASTLFENRKILFLCEKWETDETSTVSHRLARISTMQMMWCGALSHKGLFMRNCRFHPLRQTLLPVGVRRCLTGYSFLTSE